MLSNRIAVAALAVACIVAAGAGGYLASRQNATTPVPVAASTAAAPAAGSQPTADRPVQETEGVVGDVPKTSTPPSVTPSSPEPSPAPVPAKHKEARAEPPVRTAPAPAARTSAKTAQNPPPLTQTWPSSAGVTQGAPVPMPPAQTTGDDQAKADDRAAGEAPRTPETTKAPEKTYDELVVSADSVLGLQTENAISSDLARVEDTVHARVSRDVRVGDRVAIPAGTRAIGTVVQVERGGKFKEQARLGIRFHTLVLADGTRIPISTDTIYREGDAPTSAQKIGGGAVIGTILGAIVGGGKGAVIGGAAGAGAGTAATMAGNRSAATFPAGSPMTVRILSPVTVTVEQKE